jgi:hypothetical protein
MHVIKSQIHLVRQSLDSLEIEKFVYETLVLKKPEGVGGWVTSNKGCHLTPHDLGQQSKESSPRPSVNPCSTLFICEEGGGGVGMTRQFFARLNRPNPI